MKITFREDNRREQIYFEEEYAEDMMERMGLSFEGVKKWAHKKGLPTPPKREGIKTYPIKEADNRTINHLVKKLFVVRDKAEGILNRHLNEGERMALIEAAFREEWRGYDGQQSA